LKTEEDILEDQVLDAQVVLASLLAKDMENEDREKIV
jgi:hypothetical protein